jgi:chemotaxis protein MotB
MAGAGGGAWKVAYADFVTAMMAFFMVMWLTTQDKDIKESIAGYFEDPWGTSSEYSAPRFQLPSEVSGDSHGKPVPGHQPSTRQPGTEEKDLGAAGSKDKSRWTQGYRMHVLQEGDRLPPAAVIQFEEATADLSNAGKQQLDGLLPMMVGKSNRVEIRGHSTHRPLPDGGPFADHWQLCYARSQAVMTYLVQHGIEADRIRLSQSGAYEPITTRFEAAWQRENSRVEVYLLSELAGKAAMVDSQRSVGAAEANLAHTP